MNNQAELLNQLRMDRSPAPDNGGGGRTWWLLGATMVIAGIAGWWWLQREPTILVDLVRATPINVTAEQTVTASVLDASGYVTARRRATVSSRITGRVRDVMIEEGMTVEAGQILALLDDSLDQAQLALTQAQLDRAISVLDETRATLTEAIRQRERTQELSARGLASDAAVDTAVAAAAALAARLATGQQDIRVAEQALELQRRRLDDTIIRAPFSGVVIAKAAQPGEMISPVSAGGGFTRTGICTLVDMQSLEVEVDVNEAFIDRVTAGQPVSARLDAYPNWDIPASVIAIIPTADRQKATVRVRVGFDQLDSRILPDMGIKVAFLTASNPLTDTSAQVPPLTGQSLPESALRQRGERSIVFVIDDGLAREQVVSSVRIDGGRVLVRSGLQPGQQVINQPPESLQDGARVASR